jgi:hypothetical protein
MRYINSILGGVLAAFLSVSVPANAQGFFPPISVNPAPATGGAVIGPDGTYYVLVPASGSTRQAPVTELMAISVTGNTKWTATVSGDVGQVLPGATDVYVVQTVTSGAGRSATATTSVLVLNASTGVQGTPIAPTGNISSIQEKTVGANDYLYIYSVATSSSSGGGTTTFTATQTISIYLNGALVKTVTL